MKATQKASSMLAAFGMAILCLCSSAMADENLFSDWQGEFLSRDYFNKQPAMDVKYEEMAAAAREDGKDYTAAEAKEFFTKMMRSDFTRMVFDQDKVTFYYEDGKSVTHEYESGGVISDTYGGEPLEWYAFEAVDEQAIDSVYKYLLLFKVHQHGEGQAHFHLRYGSHGFDALTSADLGNWWPTGVCPDFDLEKEIANFNAKVMAKFLPEK